MKSRLLILLLCASSLISCQRHGDDLIEVNGKTYFSGDDYRVLDERISFDNSTRANVVEFFWYGCPHCQSFEEDLQTWFKSLPAESRFARLPAVWSEAMVLHARAFFTAKELDLLTRCHEQLFVKIIALRKIQDLAQQRKKIGEFFMLQGIPKHQFTEVFDSAEVTAQVQAAIALAQAAGIQSTPSFLVNGKYILTGSGFNTKTELLSLADALMQREIDRQLVDWW